MRRQSLECSSWQFGIRTLCNQDALWRAERYCSRSCWVGGNGYDGDDCALTVPVPQNASSCTDEPSSYMRNRGFSCSTWHFGIRKYCVQSPVWREHRYCSQSCWEAGRAYVGDFCLSSAPAMPPPPAPPMPPPRPSFPLGTTLRVYLLAGQSNAEGYGRITSRDNRTGDLVAITTRPGSEFAHWARSVEWGWPVREDAFVWDHRSNPEWAELPPRIGKLGVGFGADHESFGPELELGRVLADAYDEPVLVVKTAWGGKSLRTDFRPPGVGGETGAFYNEMVAGYRDAVARANETFSGLVGLAPRLEGFLWFQGWSDLCCSDVYQPLLEQLIVDVRRAIGDVPVIIGETGVGYNDTERRALAEAQAAAAVATPLATYVPTRQYLRLPGDSPSIALHHWYDNAESYLRIGQAMGEALIKLAKEPLLPYSSPTPPAMPPLQAPARAPLQFAPLLLHRDMKVAPAARLFKKRVATLELCAAECRARDTCVVFSYKSGATLCMGGSSLTGTAPHDDFLFFRLGLAVTPPSTPPLSTPPPSAPLLLAPLPSSAGVLLHSDTKVGSDGRLFKKKVNSLEECAAACRARDGCVVFSYLPTGSRICMGGSSEAGSRAQAGFSFYRLSSAPSPPVPPTAPSTVLSPPFAPLLLHRDMKVAPAARLFKKRVATLELCAAECRARDTCVVFSYKSGATLCMGGSSLTGTAPHDDFLFFRLGLAVTPPSTPPLSTPPPSAPLLLAPLPSSAGVLLHSDTKVGSDGRLFKKKVNSLEECAAACRARDGCVVFSYLPTGSRICMGGSSEAGSRAQAGFSFYRLT